MRLHPTIPASVRLHIGLTALCVALLAGLEAAIAVAAALYGLGHFLLALANTPVVLGIGGTIASVVGLYVALVFGRSAYREERSLISPTTAPEGPAPPAPAGS